MSDKLSLFRVHDKVIGRKDKEKSLQGISFGPQQLKYCFSDDPQDIKEVKLEDGSKVTLRQIIAAKTMYGRDNTGKKFIVVRQGAKGGYIQSEENLSQDGLCWAEEDSMIYDGAVVKGDSQIGKNVILHGDVEVSGFSILQGLKVAKGRTEISGSSRIQDSYIIDTSISGKTQIIDSSLVRSSISGLCKITGAATYSTTIKDSILKGAITVYDPEIRTAVSKAKDYSIKVSYSEITGSYLNNLTEYSLSYDYVVQTDIDYSKLNRCMLEGKASIDRSVVQNVTLKEGADLFGKNIVIGNEHYKVDYVPHPDPAYKLDDNGLIVPVELPALDAVYEEFNETPPEPPKVEAPYEGQDVFKIDEELLRLLQQPTQTSQQDALTQDPIQLDDNGQ